MPNKIGDTIECTIRATGRVVNVMTAVGGIWTAKAVVRATSPGIFGTIGVWALFGSLVLSEVERTNDAVNNVLDKAREARIIEDENGVVATTAEETEGGGQNGGREAEEGVSGA